jgi:hypothetical protein
MEIIKIDRLFFNDNLNNDHDINYTVLFDSLCNMSMLSKVENVNDLKKYTDFMKSKNWVKFFVGDHEITPHDISNIKQYYDTKYLFQNNNDIFIMWIQKNIHKLYDYNEFTLLDSFVYVYENDYIFVDLCWCIERGIRVFKHNIPITVNHQETEV